MSGALLTAIPRYLQLSRSQWWSPEHLDAYQKEQLDRTLRVASSIPFYADRFGGRYRAEALGSLPVLRRTEIAELNRSVRGLYPEQKDFAFVNSSGTTGYRIHVLIDGSHQRGRFAARARYLVANGWHPLLRSAWILGLRPGSTPDWKLTQSRLLVGTSFFSHIDDFETQVARLRKTDPHFVYTLPSNLEALLSIFAKQNSRLPSLRKVFTGGEVLEASVREQTRRVLGVEIADNYGSSEMFFAWQCLSGSYHLNAEHVLVEIVDEEGKPVAPGEMGKVLATTLENRLMPLIRYEVDDYAIAAGGLCPCGRTLPLIGDIIGRGVNLFHLPDGQLLSPWKLKEAFKQMPEVRQLQIVQRALDEYLIRFASDSEFGSEVESYIRRGFLAMVGATASLSFERVDKIARAPSGKFMAALCELKKEDGGSRQGQA